MINIISIPVSSSNAFILRILWRDSGSKFGNVPQTNRTRYYNYDYVSTAIDNKQKAKGDYLLVT